MEPSVIASFETLRAAPLQTAVLLDFDGTLSPIVVDPSLAVALPEVVSLLGELRERFGLVGVVSGRPVSFLATHLPDGLVMSGLYGLEEVRDGALVEHPVAARWRPVVEDAVARASASLPDGVDVEHKGLSLTLHFRRLPSAGEAAATWAAAVAAESGLEVRTAKMSLELHPPVGVDKGTVVERLVAPDDAPGFSAACFIGDDLGDLPAFDALDRLAARGVATLRVAVRTSESAPELLRRADVHVDGPAGTVEVLRALLA
ncbi:MAG: trehalose-phosphatase [Acidimicrobiales bacterium]|nr:trehalose-phosphatase [Acidimicrobiales bacterium]